MDDSEIQKSASSKSGTSGCARLFLACVALVAVVFAVFGQTIHHAFIDLDDSDYVFGNPFVIGGLTRQGIMWAFTHFHSYNWHPLTWLSHMLDCQVYGLHPGGHHLSSVLIHAATAIALFLVLRNMTGGYWQSLFVAAVFAIHPLRTESVAWVAERKDVLSGFFFMVTIGAYVHYARQPSIRRYGAVLLLFALGLMAKPMLVTVPAVLLLLDYWPLQRPEKITRLILEKLPLGLFCLMSCLITLTAQRGAVESAVSFPLPLRLANAVLSCVTYLKQMVWPVHLSPFYPIPPFLALTRIGMGLLLILGVSVFAWRNRRSQPWLVTGWLWYLIMLLPVIGIIQVGQQAHADRYTYLPQIGLCVALTWSIATLRINQTVLSVTAVAVIATLMGISWKQTMYWRDSETLARHALDCNGNNYMAHTILGDALLSQGKLEEAIPHFRAALDLKPHFAEACNNLGNALLREGKTAEAISYFHRALESNPFFPEAYYNLGLIDCRQGNLDAGIEQFRNALKAYPNYAAVHNDLGKALYQEGKAEEGIAEYQKALQIDPNLAPAYNNLGEALLKKGKIDDAITCFKKALSLNPHFLEAQANLERAIIQK